MIDRWVEFHITCDGCDVQACLVEERHWQLEGHYVDQPHGMNCMPMSHKGKRDMLKIAKSYGWRRIGGEDFCPKCLDKFKSQGK